MKRKKNKKINEQIDDDFISVESDRWLLNWRNSRRNITFPPGGPISPNGQQNKIKKKKTDNFLEGIKICFYFFLLISFDDVISFKWRCPPCDCENQRESFSRDKMRFGFHEFVLPLKVFWVWRMNEWVLWLAVHVTCLCSLSLSSFPLAWCLYLHTVYAHLYIVRVWPGGSYRPARAFSWWEKVRIISPFKWFALT